MEKKYRARLTKQDSKVGKRIQRLRKSFNLTQNDLSGIVNITPNHLSYIENGKRRPSLPLLRKLARALKANLGKIISS